MTAFRWFSSLFLHFKNKNFYSEIHFKTFTIFPSLNGLHIKIICYLIQKVFRKIQKKILFCMWLEFLNLTQFNTLFMFFIKLKKRKQSNEKKEEKFYISYHWIWFFFFILNYIFVPFCKKLETFSYYLFFLGNVLWK